MSKLTWIFIAIILIAALSIVYVIVGWVQDIDEVVAQEAVLSPSIVSPVGVDVTSSFSLTFPENVSSASVSRYLQVEPAIELGVHQGKTAAEVLLVPAQPLSEGTIYTFTLTTTGKTVSWAVQTGDALQINGSKPVDQETQVCTNDPLEFTLSQTVQIDVNRLEDYVTIDPAIEGSFWQQGRTLYFQPKNGWQELTVYHVSISALPIQDGELVLAEPLSFAFETAGAQGQSVQPLWYMTGASVFTEMDHPVFTINFNDSTVREDVNQADMQLLLYALPDAETFAACLSQLSWTHPQWSMGWPSLSDIDMDTATLLWSGTRRLTAGENQASQLQLSPKDNGYYALSVVYQGQTWLQLFQVNDLSAFSAVGGDKLLIWAHNSLSGEAATNAKVHAYHQNQTYVTDNGGAILLNRNLQEEIYLLTYGNSTLVVQDYGYNQTEEDAPYLWRYLYLDKDIYQNGDTIRFWGLVQPVDGSALAYERVSVYLYRQDEEEPLYRIYAPLDEYFFQGEWELPYLREGWYRLVVSQSGKSLVESTFQIGQASPVQNESASSSFSGPTISMGDSALALGESYRMAFDMEDAGSYLFIRDEGGIAGYAVESQPLHLGLFEPENGRNYYLWGVAYQDGEYLLTPPCSLLLDCEEREMDLAVDGALPQRTGETSEIRIHAGAGFHVAVSLIQSETAPQANVFEWIYGDLLQQNIDFVSSTNGERQVFSSAQATMENKDFQGETEYFALLTADQQGNVSVTLSPEQSGQYYLLIETIGNKNGVSCGTLCLPFTVTASEDLESETMDEQSDGVYAWREIIVDDSVSVPYAGEALLLADIGDRAVYWQYLLDAAFTSPLETDGSDVFCSVAAAQAYLSQWIAEDTAEPFFDFPNWDGGIWQREDGGISYRTDEDADLSLSLQIAALPIDVVDASWLKTYFYHIVEKPANRKQQILALTGLAALQEGVISEIYLLLDEEQLTYSEYFYLLWGLCLAGGEQNAKNIFLEKFDCDDWNLWYEECQAADSYTFSDEETWLFALLSLYWGGAEESAVLTSYRETMSTQTDNPLAQTIVAITALENLYSLPFTYSLEINNNQYDISAYTEPFVYNLENNAEFILNIGSDYTENIRLILVEREI